MEPKKPSDIQKKILLSLMHNPLMNFNKLWNREGRSNKFAYHLKILEKKGFVEKRKCQGYKLTLEGMKRVSYIESDNGENSQFPIMAVVVLIAKENKYLMIHRTKEPFHGYWGLPGGKLRANNYILEQAKESVKKETGLSCDLELKGLFSSKTYVNRMLAYNHQLFVVKAVNPKGTLIEKTRKGGNKWIKKGEVDKLRILPNIPLLVKIANGKKFSWIQADRIQKDGSIKIEMKD